LVEKRFQLASSIADPAVTRRLMLRFAVVSVGVEAGEILPLFSMSGASSNQACSRFRYASLTLSTFVAAAALAQSAACRRQYSVRLVVRAMARRLLG